MIGINTWSCRPPCCNPPDPAIGTRDREAAASGDALGHPRSPPRRGSYPGHNCGRPRAPVPGRCPWTSLRPRRICARWPASRNQRPGRHRHPSLVGGQSWPGRGDVVMGARFTGSKNNPRRQAQLNAERATRESLLNIATGGPDVNRATVQPASDCNS